MLDHFYAELVKHDFMFSAAPGPWHTVLGFGVQRDKGKRSVTLTSKKHITDLAATSSPTLSCRQQTFCDTRHLYHRGGVSEVGFTLP